MMTRSTSMVLCGMGTIFLGVAASVPAAEPAAEAKAENPLAKLPSKLEGEHVAKLKTLGDNTWLELGSPAPDPKWGKGRGRAWTPKMAFAPELRGAFLCGTGVHGFVKPDGHYMDDLFFYDINAHRWICLYPGASKETKLHLDKNGLEVNEAGDPIPVSYLSHGYNCMTYNTDLRRYMIVHVQCPWWGRAVPQRWEWLDQKYDCVKTKNYGNPGPVIATTKHPWFWDVATGKWDRKFIAGSGPDKWRYEGVLEYVPSQKKAHYLFAGGAVWIYDFASEEWKAGPKASAPSYDCVACFDPKRERIWIANRSAGFGYYDVKTSAWTAVKADGQPAYMGGGVDANLTYDTANDVLVLNLYGKPKEVQQEPGVFVFSPDKARWTANRPDAARKLRGQTAAFYDPVNNLHYYHTARDSSDNGTMLVYRYKQAKTEEAK